MKNKFDKKRQEGFTIIEVLIVLAIAGLIILIVFLAVPALQRNSRNTQRNNDVASIGGALSEFINNNNGQLPEDDGDFEANVITNANLGFYETTNVLYNQGGGTELEEVDDAERVTLYEGTICADAQEATENNATSRGVTAVYAVETGSGLTSQCKEL